jgi:hypothetical protein
MKLYCTAALALIMSNWPSAGHTRSSSSSAELLQAHNVQRRLVGAAPLLWSVGLTREADRYALYLAKTHRWGHSRQSQRIGQGENLWMGSRGAFRPEGMVAAWSSEKRLFRAGVFPNVSRTGSWYHVGHYTQMIWPGTTSVGCSVRSSASWDYLVCRYSGAGNVLGARVGAANMAERQSRRPTSRLAWR